MRFGATLWTWRESCGDAHKAADFRAGRLPEVWGVFDVSCTDNGARVPHAARRRPDARARARGPRPPALADLARVARAARERPRARRGGGPLVAWHPDASVRVTARGLARPRLVPFAGGRLVVGRPRASRWSLVVRPG